MIFMWMRVVQIFISEVHALGALLKLHALLLVPTQQLLSGQVSHVSLIVAGGGGRKEGSTCLMAVAVAAAVLGLQATTATHPATATLDHT